MKFREQTFKLEDILRKISKRICLVCSTDLDKDQGSREWHIPLCRECRAKYLDEITVELRHK